MQGIRSALMAIAMLFSFVTPVFADLSVQVSCSELQTGSYPTASTCGTSSAISANPGQVYSTSLSESSGGNSFSAIASGKANYGALGVAAYATATNVAVDWEPEKPGSTATFQLLTRSHSQSVDTFLISGISGYVDVKVDLVIDVANSYQTASGGMLSANYLSFTTSLASTNWCMSLGVEACHGSSALNIGRNDISFTASVLAGTSFDWYSSLYGEATVFNAAIGAGTVNVDALNTAHSYFTVLTEGATINWTSGHDYSVPSPVPEPEIYAMMGLGLGLMGWAARRRKQQAA